MASVSCHFSQRAARASHYGYTVCVISTGIVCARASFMVAKRFEDLIVWQRAHELQEEIFSLLHTPQPPMISNSASRFATLRDLRLETSLKATFKPEIPSEEPPELENPTNPEPREP